jgi:transposase InsO family protein
MDELKPKDHAERIALFRAQIVGQLAVREMDHGELRAALKELSQQRFRPPGSETTHAYSVPTLERWLYAYRAKGIEALKPRPRRDKGRARRLNEEQRRLLCDIRREHPNASASLIVRTLMNDGRIASGEISETTVRRMFRQQGLDKIPLRDGTSPRVRLRWQAERPNALWHGDVCHGSQLVVDGEKRSLRIHALLDDASRFVVALEALHTEREEDMLQVLVRTLRRHGKPDAFYLDNGSTYRGEILKTACGRLDVTLLHARPYDPQARGKMERFWRTLREGCLDFMGELASLHDVNVRLWAFLDQHYHRSPHAGLLGKSPESVYLEARSTADSLDEKKLRTALTVRDRRRVRRDGVVSVNGTDWELDQGYLAGQIVVVAKCLVDLTEPPWIEHDGKTFQLHPVDPVKNARLKRNSRRPGAEDGLKNTVHFDPPGALLDKATGRKPSHEEETL